MSKKLHFEGTWKDGCKSIKCRLQLIIFEEDGSTIVYCPHLDLSGYGESEEEAKATWEQSLDIYFDYTLRKGSLTKDLKRLGWDVRKSLKKKISPPPMSDLLERNEDFREIFNNHDYRQLQTTIDMPALV